MATICRLVQKGLAITHAAAKVHLHHTTIGRWRREYPEFDAALGAAEAAFIEEQTANIRGAGKLNWQASAWLLERKWPQFFSQPQIQLTMGTHEPKFEEFSVTLEKLRKDPQLMNDIEEIHALGVQKWMLLQEARRNEKVVEGREIKQIKEGRDQLTTRPLLTQPRQ